MTCEQKDSFMNSTRSRSLLTALTLLSLCLHSVTCGADVDVAKAAYNDGKFDLAFTEFSKAAQLGHAEAQFNLGAMYYKGQGVARSTSTAIAWMQLAADNGLPDTTETIAALLRETGGAANPNPAYEQLRDRYGKVALERELLPGSSIVSNDSVFAGPEDRQRILNAMPDLVPKTSTALARDFNNNPFFTEVQAIPGLSMLRAAFLIAPDGSVRGVESLFSMPQQFLDRRWYQRAAKQQFSRLDAGASVRSRMLVLLFTRSRGASQMTREVLDKLTAALLPCIQQGSPACQYYAAVMLLDPDTIGESYDALLLKAAQGGYAPAQYLIGHRLAFGEKRDFARSRTWLAYSLANGLNRAGVLLARLAIENPDGADWVKARELLRQAEARGETNAVVPLAALYAASPDPDMRNSAVAGKLLQRARLLFGETPALLEISAAAVAAEHDFAQAASKQRQAMELAQGQHWDVAVIKERLATYERNEPWYGDLLAL